MNSLANTRYTSLCLKVVGIILIVSSLLDFITLSIPLKLSQTSWQLQFVNNVVDRGIVPLIGIVLFLIGWWITNTQLEEVPRKNHIDRRFPFLVFAVVLGMCYLAVIPIHLSNINDIRRTALVKINRQAEESEARIQSEYSQIQKFLSAPQSSTKVTEALRQTDQILNSSQELSEEQRLQLEQNRRRLEDYKKYVTQPGLLEEDLAGMQSRLDAAKLEKITEANLESIKQGVRIGLNSLLLSIAYSVLGWFGLKNVIKAKTKSRASVQ
ncbi:HpsJ family protein [Gloeocapsa sp. PCC 73106]|uniref:HpsJ family protein n=1 Tax=Gloeocapsa sp. PCC 73106 TaxID=102232 RepID=UPI00118199C0|nr:HpsJ family protein [Gloeocapsa sp. PCC 73106]